MQKLNPNEYNQFYQPYIKILLDNDCGIVENLKDSLSKFELLLEDISEGKQMYQYARSKWTIKELIQHFIDAERVFNYRALRFARNDRIELSGFNENQYVLLSSANKRDYQQLFNEFVALRKSTILMYQSFTNQMLLFQGKASGNYMSVRALGFITSGHLLHHLQVIKKLYL